MAKGVANRLFAGVERVTVHRSAHVDDEDELLGPNVRLVDGDGRLDLKREKAAAVVVVRQHTHLGIRVGDGERDEAREWLFGDALHSRPLPINYGALGGYTSPDNPAIYIAVATNDGLLRMLRNTRTSGAQSGEEVWSFMPRSAMAAQKVLRANGTGMKHPYTVDGAPVAFMQDRNRDGSMWLGWARLCCSRPWAADLRSDFPAGHAYLPGSCAAAARASSRICPIKGDAGRPASRKRGRKGSEPVCHPRLYIEYFSVRALARARGAPSPSAS